MIDRGDSSCGYPNTLLAEDAAKHHLAHFSVEMKASTIQLVHNKLCTGLYRIKTCVVVLLVE